MAQLPPFPLRPLTVVAVAFFAHKARMVGLRYHFRNQVEDNFARVGLLPQYSSVIVAASGRT